MKQIYKTIVSVFIVLMLASTIDAQEQNKEKIINGTNVTTDSHIQIVGSPPWDSPSILQETNTNNMFMKIEYIPYTEWVDVQGNYGRSNYFQLPISVKLVNASNVPIKYRNVYIWIDEYKTWYEGGWFTCNCWRYEYKTTYSKTKNTGSTGTFEALYNLGYKGYDRTLYNVQIYTSDSTGKYTSYTKNIKVAWYINEGGKTKTQERIDKAIKNQ